MHLKKIFILFILVMILSIGTVEARFGSAPEGWPCVQPYVAEVSAGAFWTGELPSDEALKTDEMLMRLVEEASDRSISYQQSFEKIKTFLDQLEGSSLEYKREQAASLIVALTNSINNKRAQVLKGIQRFSKRQQMMITRIEDQNTRIKAIQSENNPESVPTLADLEARQKWDIRVFEEREYQKNYLCEQSVLLEQRFFLLGRDIVAWLKDSE